MQEKERLFALIDSYKKSSPYLSNLNIAIGKGTIESSFEKVPAFGKKVMFCTGASAMKRLGFYDKYMGLFENANIEVVEYSGVLANPTLDHIEKGVEIAKEEQVEFFFALGGGSVIDTSKAISVGLFGNVWGFIEKREEIEKGLPIVANSTTSGTGSHVTPYAVITNTKTKEKKTLKHDLILPKLSIVDVDITRHTPPYVVATTGFDVLCHAIEVYTRKDCTNVEDEFATRAIKLVGEHLVKSFGSDDVEAKTGMAFADVYAGIALALKGTHVAHAISHPISGRFPEINHGQSLAYIMPKTIEMHVRKGDEETKEKFENISRRLGGSGDCVETITELVKKLGLDKPVVELSEEDKKLIYEDVRRYRWGSVERSPHQTTEEDIKEIILNSM